MKIGSLQDAANKFNRTPNLVQSIKLALQCCNEINRAEIEQINQKTNSLENDSKIPTAKDMQEFINKEQNRTILERDDGR